jgi:hypothetical protein
MSARNGDKSRFGRQRKQKIARRLELRKLQPAGAAAAQSGKPDGVPAGSAEQVVSPAPAE